ncbi:Hypothetical_protein [Hexamita inflata]|uniref:Hypothetical_protein n=1 Tax=Hexamita inflata TaxID=28002 RepID=A0AA86P6H3_9EUKA|nr:Hypothetical protein HINF_LOCUS20449 [Hexamita inflata]
MYIMKQDSKNASMNQTNQAINTQQQQEYSKQDLYLIQQHLSNVIQEIQDESQEVGGQIHYLREEILKYQEYRNKLQNKIISVQEQKQQTSSTSQLPKVQ